VATSDARRTVVSWAPNGDLWSISLSVDRTTTRNAVLAAKLPHGLAIWSEPFTLKFDTSRAGIPLGNDFNDKESLTATPPTRAATWCTRCGTGSSHRTRTPRRRRS
jgi:hypothetical protein